MSSIPVSRSTHPGGVRQPRVLARLLCIGLLAALLVPAATHAVPPRSVVASVQRLADGDTVTAVTPNQTKLRIRLLGIDAPEIEHGSKPGQPFGKEARELLGHLIGGKVVRVEAFGADRYHRVLAVIWDGPVNINLAMVARGYAEVYRGARCQAYCLELEQAEAKARRQRLGIWSQEYYESPQAFRHRMHIGRA
jgi:micrococcal nuclease